MTTDLLEEWKEELKQSRTTWIHHDDIFAKITKRIETLEELQQRRDEEGNLHTLLDMKEQELQQSRTFKEKVKTAILRHEKCASTFGQREIAGTCCNQILKELELNEVPPCQKNK